MLNHHQETQEKAKERAQKNPRKQAKAAEHEAFNNQENIGSSHSYHYQILNLRPLLSAPDESPQKKNYVIVGHDPTVSIFAVASLVRFHVLMYFQFSSKTISAPTAKVPGLVARNTTVPPAPSQCVSATPKVSNIQHIIFATSLISPQ